MNMYMTRYYDRTKDEYVTYSIKAKNLKSATKKFVEENKDNICYDDMIKITTRDSWHTLYFYYKNGKLKRVGD